MILNIIYKFFIFPGLIFSAFLGLFLTWADKKIAARLQWRVGPPWYQPFIDILKLLGKELLIPEKAPVWLFMISPMIGLAGATLVSTILWTVNINHGATFTGDLIVVLYLLFIPAIAVILGAFSSNNPHASIGGSREMKLLLALEMPFLIAVFTAANSAGGILFGDIIKFQHDKGMLIGHLSSIIAFVVAIVSCQAKLGAVPFDTAEAEQEIAGGTLIEYSGALLAIFKLTRAVMLSALPLLLITLFLGGLDASSYTGVLYFALKYVLIIVLFALIKNTNPRLRIDQAVGFFWGPLTLLAISGFILSLFGA